MAINETKVKRMVDELEQLQFFNGLNRLPKGFYRLNDEEKAEVIKQYRRRNGLSKKAEGLE